jgi:hypothetical protein
MDTLPPVGLAGWRQKLPGFVVDALGEPRAQATGGAPL